MAAKRKALDKLESGLMGSPAAESHTAVKKFNPSRSGSPS